jgi:hypothetical protein
MEDYGFPDNFRQVDWGRDHEEVIERITRDFDEWFKSYPSEEDKKKERQLYDALYM